MDSLNEIVSCLRMDNLKKEEEMVHFIPKGDFDDGKKPFINNCYRKVLAEREFHIAGVKNVLQRAWGLFSFTISKIDRNIFHIFFTCIDDLKSVVSWDPRILITPFLFWSHGRHNWVNINLYDYWAQVRLLPNCAYTKKVGQHLWAFVRNCIQLQLREADAISDRHFRMRVHVDLNNPICCLLRIACSPTKEY